MKKIGDMMKELGFREGANEEVTKAFIKNLIKQAYGVEVKENFSRELEVSQRAGKPEQLTFDLGPISARPKRPA